jgi:Domain of unknown function (DUF4124)
MSIMSNPIFLSASALAACLLLAAIGSASAATIFTCVDSAGSTTFTDAPCVEDFDEDQTLEAKAMPVDGKQASIKAKFAAAEKARSIAASKAKGRKNLSIDARTVRIAKAAMISMDIETDLARQQVSAEKALQASKWAFWRS